jgi:hypothetical protein
MTMQDGGGGSGRLSRFVANGVTIALSGVFAWLVSSYFEYKRSVVDEGKYLLELEKDKVEIINLVKDRDTALALALIDYYRETFGKTDNAYTGFLKAIESWISTAPGQITKQTATVETKTDAQKETVTITAETIRDQLFSASRRQYAEFVVDTYKSSSAESQRRIVSALLDAIIPKNTDAGRRYRVNLYVALTFSLLPKTTLSPQEAMRLRSLLSYSEYKDSTFRLNVDAAIAKQIG